MFGEDKMKIKWIIGSFGVLLLAASLIGNAWLLSRLRMYQFNKNHGWFSVSKIGPIEYPIYGLSLSEIKQMLDQIYTMDIRQHNKDVLEINVHSRNIVDIRTGAWFAQFNGGGKTFRFNRTPTGWELDEKGNGMWIS
jgi:hypothetical protein